VMRRRLANNGVVSVAVDEKGRVEIAALGLPLDEDYDDFLTEASSDVAQALKKLRRWDREERAEAVRLAVRRAATRWSGKKPQVQVLLLGK
jgi:ribonuclease J